MFWVTQMACAQKIRNRVEVQDFLEGGGEKNDAVFRFLT